MAKKQSSAGIFERAGYALGASKLTMKHHDWVKSLKNDLVISEKKSEETKDDPATQMQDPATIDFLLNSKNQIVDLGKIVEGQTNPETGLDYTQEDVENASKEIDNIKNGMFDHKNHLVKEQTNQQTAKDRLMVDGGIHAAMGVDMQKNVRDYAAGTLPKRFNESTGKYEYLDYTTKFENDKGEIEYEYKPSNQLNMGAPIDTKNGLASIFAKQELSILNTADKQTRFTPPGEWDRIHKPKLLKQVENRLKSNPNEANNLLFTEDDFEPVLENLIFEGYFQKEDMPSYKLKNWEYHWNQWKQSVAYDVAVEDLKNKQMNPDFILEEYGKILDTQWQATQPEPTEGETIKIDF